MSPLSARVSAAGREDIYVLLQILFALYALVSIVWVGVYALRKMKEGTLLNPATAPPAFAINNLQGWPYAICVLALILLQSPLYPLVAVFGLGVFLLITERTAAEQFGLARLPLLRVAQLGFLVCGAAIFVEVPLDEVVTWTLDHTSLPHPEQTTVSDFRNLSGAGQIAASMIMAVLVFPLLEELFFRGFLLTFLKRYTSAWGAIILSGFVFAVAHLSIGAAVQLWVLGIILGLAYQNTGSLLVPIAIHGCWNLMTALGLLAEKAFS